MACFCCTFGYRLVLIRVQEAWLLSFEVEEKAHSLLERALHAFIPPSSSDIHHPSPATGATCYEGGCPEALATYSAVAGVWSCCYSLGEVLGPALGGALSQTYGFPLCATLCAAACFTMAVVTLTFFSLRDSEKWQQDSESESIPYTDSTWTSDRFVRTRSAPTAVDHEGSPLLTPCSCSTKNGYSSYGGASVSTKKLCFHNKRKSGSASVADGLAYFLKFQYITEAYVKLRRPRPPEDNPKTDLYQNYLENGKTETRTSDVTNNNVPKNTDSYCEYLDSAIFGSPVVIENMENVVMKRHNTGLVARLSGNNGKRPVDDIIRHNLEKVQFYEQTSECATLEDVFDGCECKDGVTYARGTVTVSSAGACEV